MSDNVYSPPAAELVETGSGSDSRYYVVSTTKLAVLYLATLGLYSVYWFYANWRNYKRATGESMIPVMRGIFSIFFAHSLFSRVDRSLTDQPGDEAYSWSPTALATWYVVLSVVLNITGRMAGKSIGSPTTDILSIVLMFPVLYVLMQAQKAINTAEYDPAGQTNSAFTGANILWILLGAVFWLMTIVGYLAIYGLIGA